MHMMQQRPSRVPGPAHRPSIAAKTATRSTLRHCCRGVSRRALARCCSAKPQQEPAKAAAKLPAALAAGACSLLLSSLATADAMPAQLSAASSHEAATVSLQLQQQQQQQSVAISAALQAYAPAAAPALLPASPSTAQHEQQQQQWAVTAPADQQQQQRQELLQLGQFDEPRIHWLLVVLGIGAVNVLGLQAVLKLLQASRDSSTPVTVLVCRMGLRVDSNKLQERLHFLRDMMGVEHAMFFTFEEAMQAICNPPRGCQLAYADLTADPLGSKQAGYDTFKQTAMAEQVRAAREEEGQVVHGSKPEGPQHRNMIQKLLGAAQTQDAEQSQACLLVTLVVLSKGTFKLPPEPLRDQGAFKETMKSLCGHLKLGQLLAVELLMTPDNPQDFLSEAQLMADYPFLTDLASGLRADHPGWSAAPSPFASTDDYGRSANVAESAAAAMAAMAVDVAGAEGAASAVAAAAAAAMRDEQVQASG